MEWAKQNWTSKEQKQLQKELEEMAEEKYQLFQKRIIKEQKYKILGVRLPLLRKMAKEIVKGNDEAFVKTVVAFYHEQLLLLALVIGESSEEYNIFETRADDFVKKIDNWAVCDTFCSGIKKQIKKNKEAFWQHISLYLHSKNPWIIRVGLVCMLCHYIDEDTVEKVLKRCDNIKSDFYYVKMAQAWLIATAFTKYPEKVKKYLVKNKLDTWTLHKAIQKACESKKSTVEEKNYLKTLKIKERSV